MKSKASMSDEKQWQVEDDMRTLLRAKEIQRDPKRMAAVRQLAKEKMADMQTISKQ